METVSIARRYHRTLLGEKGIFIHDIESKTSSTVRFPPKETASDVVTIFGPESQIHIAAQMLLVSCSNNWPGSWEPCSSTSPPLLLRRHRTTFRLRQNSARLTRTTWHSWS